jgi:hypothetical protein
METQIPPSVMELITIPYEVLQEQESLTIEIGLWLKMEI